MEDEAVKVHGRDGVFSLLTADGFPGSLRVVTEWATRRRRDDADSARDCQEFRVRAGIVGMKETPHASTQTTCDRRLAA